MRVAVNRPRRDPSQAGKIIKGFRNFFRCLLPGSFGKPNFSRGACPNLILNANIAAQSVNVTDGNTRYIARNTRDIDGREKTK
jgi:hypothetical protein